MATSLRKQSTIDFESGNHLPTLEDLQTGALMRIADATEKMAGNYIQLQNERDRYERYYKEARESINRRDRQISSLRGQITKLKNKIAAIVTN